MQRLPIYLSLGSNLGNRFDNLRDALERLAVFFHCNRSSIVLETSALLPPGATENWNLPFLNMVIVGTSSLDPFLLLNRLKNLEKEMGRSFDAPRWSPRIIDIDIVAYGDQVINCEQLCIPHREIKNRAFLRYLLTTVGFREFHLATPEDYKALNYFTLDPKFVGIVNVTPDSFSDGGKYFAPDAAVNRIRELYGEGACVIELGAQSTRPGYGEIPPSEEIARLDEILEKTSDIADCLGLDTYFDEVVKYAIKKYNLKWINDVKSQLSDEVIKLIADRNAKFVIMLHGMNISWLAERVSYLENLGFKRANMLLDPGVGFGKSKLENIEIIRNISRIKEMGCGVLLAHSRKSFISSFSNAATENRDLETLAISALAAERGVDYLRIHNLEWHMRFFVAQKLLITRAMD
ncbi:MAG: dihydropteroate synthase [Holosporaceae bacterium]|nr:dihydropteroate synthase [Holosporaceae bacterium]